MVLLCRAFVAKNDAHFFLKTVTSCFDVLLVGAFCRIQIIENIASGAKKYSLWNDIGQKLGKLATFRLVKC